MIAGRLAANVGWAQRRTWNPLLQRRTGRLSSMRDGAGRNMGCRSDRKARRAHVLLAPTINIQRSPLGRRGFEPFSEDPILSGSLAGFYCKGVQLKKVRRP